MTLKIAKLIAIANVIYFTNQPKDIKKILFLEFFYYICELILTNLLFINTNLKL